MISILEDAKKLNPRLIELRTAFHRDPEVSNHEERTAEKIRAELEAIGGYQIRSGIGGHGILADLKGGKPGKTIALRADMDALSIREETGLPFSSENPGVMHACGHDAHMTCLLGAARLLRQHQESLSGAVRLIFQPAEEMSPVGGARRMIEAGALQDVDAVFGLHVWPNLPIGSIGVRPGPQMAASDHFSVRIEGDSAHGAMPHLGHDALVAAAQFISAVQSIVSRNTDPLEACVVTIGVCQAGSRYNIVPESCLLEGTVRTYSPEVRKQTERRLGQILNGICEAMECKGTLNYEYGYCALRNDPEMADYMLKEIRTLFGEEAAVVPERPAMTAEDFAFYLTETPGAFAWLGTQALDDPDVWPLHSSHYKGNEDALWRGSAFLASLVLDFKR
jgi:hypothetical protein